MQPNIRVLFKKSRFTNLMFLNSSIDVDDVYERITIEAINRINAFLCLNDYKLQHYQGAFCITNISEDTKIIKENINYINNSYINGLVDRCKNDLSIGNYDSVITKSRTTIEEVLIYILEQNYVAVENKGNINKYYNQVKELFNMNQRGEYDRRINGLLGGLEKLIQNISEMRNANSDSHGTGSKRIKINENEAKLVMNSSITFCQYILGIFLNQSNE